MQPHAPVAVDAFVIADSDLARQPLISGPTTVPHALYRRSGCAPEKLKLRLLVSRAVARFKKPGKK